MNDVTSLTATEMISRRGNPRYPRISLKDIQDFVLEQHYFHPAESAPDPNGIPKTHPFWTTTICIVMFKNGWVSIGHSTPADARNFDPEVGKIHAYDDAMRKMWPMLGFLLRQTMYEIDNPTA